MFWEVRNKPDAYLDAAGLKIRHIPYKGVGPMVTDLLGGQVDFAAAALPSVQGHIASGKLRPIGIFPVSRTPAAPNIPTFAEQGLTNFEVEAWFAVIGPKRRGKDTNRRRDVPRNVQRSQLNRCTL